MLQDMLASQQERYPEPFYRACMNLFDSHDAIRVLSVLSGAPQKGTLNREEQAEFVLSDEALALGKKRLRLASSLAYSMPQPPCLYYGDEAGVTGLSDPFNRSTYPWGHEDTALLDWFRTLGRLRAERESLQSGGITYPLAAGRVLCFARRADDEVSLCAVNAGAESASVDLPWAAPLAHDALSGQSFLAEGGRLHITLAPYNALLLTE